MNIHNISFDFSIFKKEKHQVADKNEQPFIAFNILIFYFCFILSKKLNINCFIIMYTTKDGVVTVPFFGVKDAHGEFSQFYMCDFMGIHTNQGNVLPGNLDEQFIIGKTFCCKEQWMMAHKALLFNDILIYNDIMNCATPTKIKALGRKVSNFDGAIWDQYKYLIVCVGTYLQFSQNDRMKQALLDTIGTQLVEASPYDKIWGIGIKKEKINLYNFDKFPGSNLLGKALMDVRHNIATETDKY